MPKIKEDNRVEKKCYFKNNNNNNNNNNRSMLVNNLLRERERLPLAKTICGKKFFVMVVVH